MIVVGIMMRGESNNGLEVRIHGRNNDDKGAAAQATSVVSSLWKHQKHLSDKQLYDKMHLFVQVMFISFHYSYNLIQNFCKTLLLPRKFNFRKELTTILHSCTHLDCIRKRYILCLGQEESQHSRQESCEPEYQHGRNWTHFSLIRFQFQ